MQNHFHYVHDPVNIELVKSVTWIDDEIENQGFFMGDCDDATAYLSALLLSVGYPTALVVVSPVHSPTMDFRHIYLRTWYNKARTWIGLDPTAKGKPFGWEVPNQREKMYEVT